MNDRPGRRSGVRSAAAAWLFAASCVTPPVVLEAHDRDWRLDASGYPLDARLVEWTRKDAPALRGIFVPADEGAPVVVHFAESGGSITASMHTRDQYAQLADLGFASLALDYRGVGMSEGERSPRDLATDAWSMVEAGLTFTGSDPSRIVLRGTSLGGIALASVLERGFRPGAVIVHAPVLAESVALRYGTATMWDPLVWIARPFLRSFATADLVDELAACPAPLIVLSLPDDELLTKREFEALRAATLAAGGEFVEPRVMRITSGDIPVSRQLETHIAVSMRSFTVMDAERALLTRAFPDVPPISSRVERALADGDAALAERVRADDAARLRLARLAAETRSHPADALLAAALRIEDPELAIELLARHGRARRPWQSPFRQRPAQELLALLDHADPLGALPVQATIAARDATCVIGMRATGPVEDEWPRALLAELAVALAADAADFHSAVYPAPRGQVAIHRVDSGPWRMRLVSGDGRVEETRLDFTAALRALSADAALPEEERARRVLRVLLKATGHAEIPGSV